MSVPVGPWWRSWTDDAAVLHVGMGDDGIVLRVATVYLDVDDMMKVRSSCSHTTSGTRHRK